MASTPLPQGSLSTIGSYTTGASGVLMAVPQLNSLLSLNNPANTIGYQPQRALGGAKVNPPALIFQYEGEQSVTLESDITDSWVEDNSAIQDQIALHPEVITTRGFIGELSDAAPNSVIRALQIAANKATLLEGLSPGLTISAREAYNRALFLYQTALIGANSAVSAFSTISGALGTPEGMAIVDGGIISNITPQNFLSRAGLQSQGKQQVYFQQFYGYWSERVLFTIQTPWAVFKNMAIKTLRAIQDAETNMITDFEITFKTIRYAKINYERPKAFAEVNATPGTRTAQQSQGLYQGGTTNLSNDTTAVF